MSKETSNLRKQAELECRTVEKYLKAGNPPTNEQGNSSQKSATRLTADELALNRVSLDYRIGKPDKPGYWKRKFNIGPNWALYKPKPIKEVSEELIWEPSEAEAEDPRLVYERKIVGLEDEVKRLKQSLKESHRDALDQDAIIAALGVLKSAPVTPPDWLVKLPGRKDKPTPEVPVVIFSDWHVGDVVNPEEVNGVNSYDMATAERRVQALVTNLIHLCKNHHSGVYPGIVVNLLGDFISGELHPELAKTDEQPVLGQTLKARELLVWALTQVADHFGKVYVPCSAGNHGRITPKPEYKGYVRRNFDWFIYKLLESHFEGDKRIKFDIRESNDVHYKVFGTSFLATHGDMLGVRGGDGIIGILGPVARGEIKTSRQASAFDREYDVLLIGHYHQSLWLPRAIVSNALCGFDPYAMKVLRAVPSTPSQTLFFVHPGRGITARWNVLVEDEDQPRATEWVSVFEERHHESPVVKGKAAPSK